MKTSIEVILIKSPNCTSALGNEDTKEIMEILKTQWLSDLLHDSRLWNDSIILCHNGAKYTAQALGTLIIKATPSFPFHS